MSDIAIRVEGLSKQYRIGGKQERYRTLRDTLTDAVAAPFWRAGRLLRGEATGAAGLDQTIWALKDVSFEVKRGEVVGIIGANGAGKSTLLKILSRITEPTEGYADVFGRVGSLLEVGTGFHPELTGRENIYLNGAILGMTREEIDRKFDEIVDFAGVEKFIDTPVKHYSSGMGLRLGFAVAAHLDPEILVVDEVLAVGDAAFQKKCLGKMGEVASEGRTVLFVSHNMAAVQNLCGRAIILHKGRIRLDSSVDNAVQSYLSSLQDAGAVSLAEREDRVGGKTFRFTEVTMLNKQKQPTNRIPMGDSVYFRINYTSSSADKLRNVFVTIRIEDMLGQYLFSVDTRIAGEEFTTLPAKGMLECMIPALPLLPGEYRLYLSSTVNNEIGDRIENAFRFTVDAADVFGSGWIPRPHKHGSYFVEHSWVSTPLPLPSQD